MSFISYWHICFMLVWKLLWWGICCSFMQSDSNASNSSLAEANGQSSNSTLKHSASLALERQGGTLKPYQSMRLKKRLSMYSRSMSHSRINFGDANDDVHLCILCLRAIMNHQVHSVVFTCNVCAICLWTILFRLCTNLVLLLIC